MSYRENEMVRRKKRRQGAMKVSERMPRSSQRQRERLRESCEVAVMLRVGPAQQRTVPMKRWVYTFRHSCCVLCVVCYVVCVCVCLSPGVL